MSRLPPLVEETLAATVAMTALSVAVALVYRLVTGFSPWPELILAEIAAFGTGIALLAFGSPRRSR